MINIDFEFLAVLLGKTVEELQESLKPVEEGKTLTSAESRNILEPFFKEKMNRQYNDGFNKAKKKSDNDLTKAQKDLLEKIAQGFDVELQDDIDSLLDAAKAKATTNTKSGEGIKDTDVLNSPLYKQLKATSDKAVADAQKGFDDYRAKVDYDNTLGVVKGKALSLLQAKSFDLTDNETVRQNLLNAMFNELTVNAKISIGQDGEIILADAEGAAIKDAYGNPRNFDNYVEDIAKGYFLPKQQQQQQQNGGGTGNNNQPPANNGGKSYAGFNFAKPSSAEEARQKQKAIKEDAEFKAYTDYIIDLRTSGELQ